MNIPSILRNLSCVPVLTVAQQALTSVEKKSQGISPYQCYKLVQYILTLTTEAVERSKILNNNKFSGNTVKRNGQENESKSICDTEQYDSKVIAKVFRKILQVSFEKSSIELEYLAIIVSKHLKQGSKVRQTFLLFGIKYAQSVEYEYSTYFSRLSNANDEEQFTLFTRQYSPLIENTADYLDVVEFDKNEGSSMVTVKINNSKYSGSLVSGNTEVIENPLNFELVTSGISDLWTIEK